MSGQFEFGGEIAWRPTRDYVENSRLVAFMTRHGLRDYEELLHRSVTDLEWFWSAVLADLGIEFYERPSRIVDTSGGIPWTRWCVDGRLNIVHNCLDKWIGTDVESRDALRWEGEEGLTRTMTYRQLFEDVNRCANGLRTLGVQQGDRVALFMPMCPELIVAFFATIKLGAIILPLFSGYGAEAVATRLRDADAGVLVTADGFWRRGQPVLMKAVADEAAAQCPSLRHMVVVPRLGQQPSLQAGRDWQWDDLVAGQSSAADTERTSAEDPLMIIYTSGTTGKPKGALHTHCGFPIKAAQDILHGLDLHPDETLWWVTDIGWMMGPWLIFGTLLLGATMMLYDGALDHPAPDRLWDLCEKHKVTALGISPTLIRALLKHGEAPVRAHDLSSLRKFASTGEPWNPAPWIVLFETVGRGKLPIINYSGGTEISGGILMGNV